MFQPKTRQHQSTLDELTRNLNFLKSSVEKEELMSGGSAQQADATDGKDAQQLIGPFLCMLTLLARSFGPTLFASCYFQW